METKTLVEIFLNPNDLQIGICQVPEEMYKEGHDFFVYIARTGDEPKTLVSSDAFLRKEIAIGNVESILNQALNETKRIIEEENNGEIAALFNLTGKTFAEVKKDGLNENRITIMMEMIKRNGILQRNKKEPA